MAALFSIRSFVLCVVVLSLIIDVPLVLCQTAAPAPFVKLRIEGSQRTIFEGNVRAFGHDVTTASSQGAHHCDGTNDNAGGKPGRTALAALDNGSRGGLLPGLLGSGFLWDANYTAEFDDFTVIRIAEDVQDDSSGILNWGLLVDNTGKYDFIVPPRGCIRRVNARSEVLWAYNALLQIYFLRLSGPTSAKRGVPFRVTVVDGTSDTQFLDKASFTIRNSIGGVVRPANVNAPMTGTNGVAMITIKRAGQFTIKAERESAIRSNAITVVVR